MIFVLRMGTFEYKVQIPNEISMDEKVIQMLSRYKWFIKWPGPYITFYWPMRRAFTIRLRMLKHQNNENET
jgi:hypothetical protein